MYIRWEIIIITSMLTVDTNKQSWETGYKVIREVAKTDGK